MDTNKKMDNMKEMSHAHHMHSQKKNGEMDHSMHMGNFKQRFFISLLLSIPIILLTPIMGISLPFSFTFVGSDWLVFILATILFFYGGQPFLAGAKMELQMRAPAMMTLISLGISVSYIYSSYGFLVNKFTNSSVHFMSFFWELSSLIVIMLLGHWIEMSALSKAGDALEKMAALIPKRAHLIEEDGNISEISTQQIKTNDHLLIKAGESIPADGVVISGYSTVNESLITGEAKDIAKAVNDKVIGGGINGSGVIKISVTQTSDSGYLSQVMELVKKAQKDKSKIETLSSKVAKWLFYVALFVGILAFVIWFIATKDVNVAISRMVTVFIIACPHALGLAIPLVIARSTSLGAKNGLLIQNRKALEEAKKITTVLMDKTGTLTQGNFSLRVIKSFSNTLDGNGLLTLFAALETSSNHPLSIGILKAAKESLIDIPTATDVQNISGVGLSGRLGDDEYFIVTEDYLNKNHISYDKDDMRDVLKSGYTVSFLLKNKEVLGLVGLGDEIKPNSKELINGLKQEGIKAVMLTGDNEASAKLVAKELGIEDFRSMLLPEDKEKVVKEYQAKDEKVMMVGDGINDAPSLARANIGVAIGAGTDVAIDSADVILVKSDPQDILVFLTLAKKTMKKMVQNIWWGAGYNIVAIPLAAGILAPIGIVLSPAVGAVLMSASTVIVAINAMSLNLKKRI